MLKRKNKDVKTPYLFSILTVPRHKWTRLSAAKGGKPVETGWKNSDELNIVPLIRIFSLE